MRQNGVLANRSNQWIKRAMPVIERFARKCAFDPSTGCVMWAGTTTSGKGRTEPYGRFWFDGKFWLAHRWSAEHIHSFEIDGLEVDHCCPAGPSSLCVQHVKPEPGEVNRALRHERTSRPWQSLESRRYWLFVDLGIEPAPTPATRIFDPANDVPFFEPPEWLRPYLPDKHSRGSLTDDCPF